MIEWTRVRAACAAAIVVLIVMYMVGGVWVGAQPPTLGERVAEHSAQLAAHEKALADLHPQPERMTIVETEVRGLKWLLITLHGLALALIGAIMHTGKKLRRNYHQIAQFMEAARQVPAIHEKLDALPCVTGHVRCLPVRPNGGLASQQEM